MQVPSPRYHNFKTTYHSQNGKPTMCNAHCSTNTELNQATIIPAVPLSSSFSKLVSSCRSKKIKESQEEEGGHASTKRRAVTFHETVVVYGHIHINDMPQRIISRTWYNPQDLFRIKQEVMFELANISKDDALLSCHRGLEYRTLAGAEQRRRNKEQAWDAVLNEQDRQWNENIIDEESIARACRACSYRSALEAHELAIQDAAEVVRDTWPVPTTKILRLHTTEASKKSPIRPSQIGPCYRAA